MQCHVLSICHETYTALSNMFRFRDPYSRFCVTGRKDDHAWHSTQPQKLEKACIKQRQAGALYSALVRFHKKNTTLDLLDTLDRDLTSRHLINEKIREDKRRELGLGLGSAMIGSRPRRLRTPSIPVDENVQKPGPKSSTEVSPEKIEI